MANLDQNAARLQDAIYGVINETAKMDGDIADALRRLSAQAAGLAPPDHETVAAAATAIPPRGTSPAEVKKWWDSLSPMQRESLLFTHTAEIGALDGIPAVARDRANRRIDTPAEPETPTACGKVATPDSWTSPSREQ